MLSRSWSSHTYQKTLLIDLPVSPTTASQATRHGSIDRMGCAQPPRTRRAFYKSRKDADAAKTVNTHFTAEPLVCELGGEGVLPDGPGGVVDAPDGPAEEPSEADPPGAGELEGPAETAGLGAEPLEGERADDEDAFTTSAATF